MTSPDRFSKFTTQFQCADGSTRPADVYSYESTNAIYDVLVIEGAKFVRTNGGRLSNMINHWTPHHYAIERRFGL